MDAPAPSDPDLLAQVARGDRRAFEAFYGRHARAVMGFLHRLCRDAGLAEDLTQETFVRAWRAAARYEPRASARPWLFAIARRLGWNAAAHRARRRGVWRPAAAAAGTEAPPAAEAWETAARREESARVAAALAALSPRLRLVFVLVRLEGLSFPEAAEVAGIPVGTAKSRMAAAEAWLRRRLGGEGA